MNAGRKPLNIELAEEEAKLALVKAFASLRGSDAYKVLCDQVDNLTDAFVNREFTDPFERAASIGAIRALRMIRTGIDGKVQNSEMLVRKVAWLRGRYEAIQKEQQSQYQSSVVDGESGLPTFGESP